MDGSDFDMCCSQESQRELLKPLPEVQAKHPRPHSSGAARVA